MKFDQKLDGSCEIIFSEKEIEVIKNHKKLFLTKEFLRHFSNTLVKISIEFNKRFDDKTKNLKTTLDTPIEGTSPKEND
tara:strand:+ start:282 stop:518 length:237 start_codon:yes stop_codon:yes gene_type:complete